MPIPDKTEELKTKIKSLLKEYNASIHISFYEDDLEGDIVVDAFILGPYLLLDLKDIQ